MKEQLKNILITAGLILCTSVAYSQDVPLGTLPMFYNSSFAGEANGGRFSSNLGLIRNRFANSYGFQSSYDQFVPAIRSGIGVNVGYSGTSNLINANFSTLGLAVAPKFSLKGKLTISPSLDFHYGNQNSITSSARGFKTRAGILVNTSKFFIGYSLDVYESFKIENSVTSETRQITRTAFDNFNSSLQMGYTFQKSGESKFSFTPQILVVASNSNRFQVAPVKLMLNFRHSNFLWGVSDDGLHIGWQTSKLRLMAFNNVQRYFITITHIDPSNISTLSFRYNFTK